MNSSTAFASNTTQPRRCDLLVRNATVWTVDSQRRTYSPGAIAISGDRIVDVGPDQDVAGRFVADRTVDAGGAIAHPGFIEAHTHVSMHLTREAFPDAKDSPGYFSSLISSLNELSAEDEYASALLASAEMLRAGITTFADSGTVMDTASVGQAVESAGIRGLLADPFVWDVEDNEWTSGLTRFPCDEASAMERLGGELWRNEAQGLVRGHIALWGLGTASDRLLLEAKAQADRAGVAVTQHQSMEPRDVARHRARLDRSPLAHFKNIGFLGRNVSLSHMNYLAAEDREALQDSGASIVWVPGNFLFYSLPRHTRSPVPDLVSRQVNLAFGTDVAKAWGYGEQALLGYLAVRCDGEFLPAESLLDMATIGGAQSIGLSHQVGSIEPDKLADIVLRDPMRPELQPGIHQVRNTMLGLRSKGVLTVIVNGEIVVENGRLTKVDEEEAFRMSRERARGLAQRIGVLSS